MLSLERPMEVKGIPIFRDHTDGRLFYYAAPHPKISDSGGRLLFDLHMYSVELKHSPLSGTTIPDELGAGFLTMTVDCELKESDLNAIRYELSTLLDTPAEEIVLFPIPYTKGNVRILALDKFSEPGAPAEAADSPTPLKNRPTFVEQVLGSSTPALLGDLRTIFSLSLSQEGVTFLEGLYRGGAAPVGVTYELTFLGLRPAIDVEITADLSRIYTHFGGGLEIQCSWLKADISAALDHLEETGAIQVNITSQAVGEEAQKSKELAMSLFKDRIVKDMFRATTQPPVRRADASGLASLLGGSSSSNSLAFKLEYKKSEELKTVTYNFSEVAPEERIHAPQGFLAAMISENEMKDRIHRVDLDSDFFEVLDVLVAGPSDEEFEALGIRQVEATLSYGAAEGDADVATLLFRPGNTGDKTFAVRRKGRTSLAYDCALTYEFSRSKAVDTDSFRYELGPRTSTGRTLRINPFADFSVLDVEVEPGRIHQDILSVDVDLRYAAPDGAFEATETLRLNPQQDPPARHHWQVRTAGTELSPYQAQYTFFFQDGSAYEGQEQSFTDPLLRVDSPFPYERKLHIRPNVVSQEIDRITIEIEYEDEENGYNRSFLLDIDPPFESKQIAWPILDSDAKRIRYRATVYEPGFLSETEWLETEDPSIVVGAIGSRVAVVNIRLIGPDLADVGVDAVLVKVESVHPAASEGQQSILLEGQTESVEVRMTLPPDTKLAYRYQTTAFMSDGSVAESEWKESNQTILPLPTRTLGT